MRALLFSIFCLLLLDVHAAEPCNPSEILGELSGMNFVGKEAIPVTKWSKLPKSLSIHDGEFGRLKFKDGDLMKFTYTGKDHKGANYSKTLEAKIGSDHIADIKLMKWFDEAHSYNGGKIQISLYKNKKKICTYNMEITGGD
ncbi:hypothetical protein [Halobacteriovorax sp. JY17]|uniref:hypothetical protein n=1 Tax=Halobacteriovorax sp. JY17 TaxID=2014617 RepID=UPI0025C2CD22|nr:hypothetical protein [Halobacteriovorax sp. JY17]